MYDAGWSAFVSMLEYKAGLHGRDFHRIGRWEPTSQVCSACGVKDGPKPLNVREWECGLRRRSRPGGHRSEEHPRPGHRERLNACGGHVRPLLAVAPACEAGSRRSAA